ncbi:hypothetical protein JG687_00005419, partial [Phytophthora cactorum]
FTLSGTTSLAKNVADHIDTEQESRSKHLPNLCIGYGIGLKDNIQTTTVWNKSTSSWDKVVTTVAPGGALDEGGDVIHKMRKLNNYFRSLKQRNALKKIHEALSYPELEPMADQDVRVAYNGKLVRRSVVNYAALMHISVYQRLYYDNTLSSYVVVFRRLAENNLKAFKFEAMATEAPGAKDANEARHHRVLRTRSQFSDAGRTCLKLTLLQLQGRFPKVSTEVMACILLDPRTKSRAKRIEVIGDIPCKEEKA